MELYFHIQINFHTQKGGNWGGGQSDLEYLLLWTHPEKSSYDSGRAMKAENGQKQLKRNTRDRAPLKIKN